MGQKIVVNGGRERIGAQRTSPPLERCAWQQRLLRNRGRCFDSFEGAGVWHGSPHHTL